jgi:hypothetical protein
MSMLTVHAATTPHLRRSVLVLAARLRRLLNGWVAAAIAYHEREAALFAQQLGDRELDNTRIYRGPIDDAFEKAAQLRKRRRASKT